jgi:hypothetical protein
MKALVVNALGGGFDLDDIDIAAPIGANSKEAMVDWIVAQALGPPSFPPRPVRAGEATTPKRKKAAQRRDRGVALCCPSS